MFEMHFQGLITHARVVSTADGKTRQVAVLFNVPDNPHVPLLTLRDDDVIEVKDAQQVGTGEDGTAKCYRLSGEIALDVPAGLPDLFLAHVPSLTRLSTGRSPKASIGNRDADPAFSTYVTLAQGSIFVGDWFSTKAIFGDNDTICVPRTVVYAANADRNVKLTMRYERDARFFTATFEVKPNAIVRVSNVELIESAATNHFKYYAGLFEDDDVNIIEPTGTTEPCEVSTKVTKIEACSESAHMSVQCTNTTFP